MYLTNNQTMSSMQSEKEFTVVHSQFMDFMKAMPDEETFTPGFYAFNSKAAIYNWLYSYATHDS